MAKEIKLKRQNNARIKRYFEEYQVGLRKNLTTKKTQGKLFFFVEIIITRFLEEQMLKKIFEDGLKIQKNKLRELRQYAKG
jgi:centrosomal protein CEP95